MEGRVMIGWARFGERCGPFKGIGSLVHTGMWDKGEIAASVGGVGGHGNKS